MSNDLERSILNQGSQPEVFTEDIRQSGEAEGEQEYHDAIDELDTKYGSGEKQLIEEQDYSYVKPGISRRDARQSDSQVPYVPSDRPGHKTGPKGVLADKRAHDRAKAQEHERQHLEYQAMMDRLQNGAISETPSTSLSSTHQQEKEQFKRDMHNDKYTDEEENSDEDIDDMDFLKTYKAQRMEELKAIKNLPHYGSVKELESPYELLDEINNSDKVTPVVVHLYEDFEPACRALNRCMNDAAPKLWHVKFIRIKSRLASPEGRWDPVALPTVIAYRGGETVASLVRVSDDIGADPSVETLESYLSSNISNFDANDSAKLYWRPSK